MSGWGSVVTFLVVRWLDRVAVHAGAAGLLMVAGAVVALVAAGEHVLNADDKRFPTVVVAVIGIGLVVIGAVWRKRRIGAARRQRMQAATAEGREQLSEPAVAWAQTVTSRADVGSPAIDPPPVVPNWDPPAPPQ